MTVRMRDIASNLSAIGLIVGLLASPAVTFADNSASAYTKDGTAVIGAASALAGVADYDGYTKVLSTTLKNSGTPKDLIIGLSFETSLFTMTMVQSKGGKKSHAVADAEMHGPRESREKMRGEVRGGRVAMPEARVLDGRKLPGSGAHQ